MNDTITDPITNTEAELHSLDVIARVAELAALPFPGLNRDTSTRPELVELRLLVELEHQGSNELGAAWDEGVTLIREDSFEQHVADGVRETRVLPDGDSWTGWPWKHIDWSAVAQDERSQYAELELDGVTYLVRTW